MGVREIEICGTFFRFSFFSVGLVGSGDKPLLSSFHFGEKESGRGWSWTFFWRGGEASFLGLGRGSGGVLKEGEFSFARAEKKKRSVEREGVGFAATAFGEFSFFRGNGSPKSIETAVGKKEEVQQSLLFPHVGIGISVPSLSAVENRFKPRDFFSALELLYTGKYVLRNVHIRDT